MTKAERTKFDELAESQWDADDLHLQEPAQSSTPELGEFHVPEENAVHRFGNIAEQLASESISDSGSEPTIPRLDKAGNDGFVEEQSDAQQLSLRQRLSDRRLLLGGLLCSLLLHLTLGGVIVNLEPELDSDFQPTQVVVRLIPENPLLVDNELLPDEPLVESVEELVEESIDIIEEQLIEESPEPPLEAVAETEVEVEAEEPIPESEPTLEENSEQEIAETDIAESLPPELPVAPPVLVVPSTAEVVRSIETMEDASRSRLWAYDCNARQEESDLLNCDRQATPDYNIVRENSTYRNLNPTREISRSQRTLPTVAENADALAGKLQSVNIPEGLGEYLMEEVEAGITHNSNLGNMPIYNIQIMTDNSDSAKFFRETQTDPWRNPGLMTEFKEKQQRQVHEQ